MKAKLPSTIGYVIFLGVVAVRPAIAADPNVDLMKSLYTKIGSVVGVGSNDPVAGESFLVLANPGILLDPNLDMNKKEDRARLYGIVDKVLIPSWIYGTRDTTIYTVYSNSLTYAEPAVIKPTAEQIKQYKSDCKILFSDCDQALPGTPSDAYVRYVDKKKALTAATQQAWVYQNTNHTDTLPPDLESNLEIASNDFELVGHRVEIETAMSTMDTLKHVDPATFFSDLKGKLKKNSDQTVNGPIYNFYPSYPTWLDPKMSWTSLTLNQSDLEQTIHNSQSSVGGGLSAGWGLWSVGADYQHSEQRTYFELNASGISVQMELTRVTFARPWFDDTLFTSRAWKFLGSSPYAGNMISDGGNAPGGATPTGLMPFVPTGLLLARNVTLSGSWSHDLQTTFNQQTSGGASVGWGPFSFSGRYSSAEQNSYIKANAAGNTISWSAPQVIGYFVEVLPKSPYPNPCYHFASDPNPPAPCAAPAMSVAHPLLSAKVMKAMAKSPALSAQIHGIISGDSALLTEASSILSKARRQHQQ